MKNWTRILSFIVVCMMLYPCIQLQAETNETTYYEKTEDSYGVHCGKFKVNQIWAFCADAQKDSPPKGTKIKDIELSSNEKLRKVLWYGSIGPGAILDNNDDGWVQTAQAVSLACNHGTLNSRYIDWYETVLKKETPPNGFKVYIATPEANQLQPLAYFIYEPKGMAQLVKSSSNEDTQNNSNYSLGDAKYGVYTNKSCTNKVATFETKSNGKSKILELEPDIYYVKETVAPKGYELSEKVYTLEVKADETTVLKVKDNPIKGKLQLIKSSASPNLTNNHECYSLKGARYGVFTDKKCTDKVATLETDEEGKSHTISLLANTYYVKETKRPKGYALDEKAYAIKVSADGKTVTKLSVKDEAQMEPMDILVKKVEATEKEGVAKGAVSLQGAYYEVKYYAVLLDDREKNPKEEGIEPAATWVMQTDREGYIYLEEEYKIYGDSFYKDSKGVAALPIGTVTIQEIKAPEGYLLNEELYVRQITQEGTKPYLETYQYPITEELLLELEVLKLQKNTDKGIPQTVFEHQKPDGATDTLITDEHGRLQIQGLQYGIHKIREVSVINGYQLHEKEIQFQVHTDNSITLLSKEEEESGELEFQVNQKGSIQLILYNELAPYEFAIYKQNQAGEKVDGAEFSLYEERECITQVQRGLTKDGTLKMNNLIVGKTYYLQETKAPDGYRLPTDKNGNPVVYEIRVESDPVRDVFICYVNGKAQEKAELTVVNEAMPVLPNTGSSAMLMMTILGSLFIGIGVYPIVQKRERKKR